MSYEGLEIILKTIVVVIGILLVLSGFADLSNASLIEEVIQSVFGLTGAGLLKIVVGIVLILAVLAPEAIGEVVDALIER